MAPAPMNTRLSWDLPGSGRRRLIYDGEWGARVESVNGRFVRLHIHSTFPTNFIRGAGTPCDPGAAAEKIIAAPSPPDRFRAAYVPYEHRGRGAGGRKVRRASLLGQNPRHVIFTPPPPPPCAMPAACPLFPANRGRYRHRPHGQPPSDGEGAPNRGRGRGGGDLLAPCFAGTEAAPVTPASFVFLVSDKTPFPFLLPAPAAERIFTAPSPSPYPRPGNGVCTLAWRVSQEGQAGRCIYTPLPIGPSDCSTT